MTRSRMVGVICLSGACAGSNEVGVEDSSGTSQPTTEASTQSAGSSGTGSAESGSGSSGPPVPTTSSSDDNGGAPKLDVGGVASESGGETGFVEDCPCENVQDGIYVLDTDFARVLFFDPLDNTFTEVGVLGCPAPPGATANSMAVDRQGNAWFNYYQLGAPNQGWLYRAALDDLANCVDVGHVGIDEWFLLGMGYSVDVPGGSCDTLYLYNSDQYANNPDFVDGSSVARWDEDNGVLDVIGTTDYPVAELAGTGNARLFAFATVPGGDTLLAELDKNDGSARNVIPLEGLSTLNGFAFAFWGGDAYFFTGDGEAGANRVSRLDYDGGGRELETVVPQSEYRIFGAGASTCASFVPPD
ncbi:MAG: hypothetical protein IAG13_36920 [Deltaproteobacteria bacterium]|nr:hypothetical protein [Nannocystaceae bacterium]